jgi:hypothetical protein
VKGHPSLVFRGGFLVLLRPIKMGHTAGIDPRANYDTTYFDICLLPVPPEEYRFP